MTALAAHLPHLANAIAFAAIVVALAIGYAVSRAIKNAPLRDDWFSSGDERYQRNWERRIDADATPVADAALADVLARRAQVSVELREAGLG